MDLIKRQDAIDVARKCLVKEVTPAYRLIDKAEVMTELMMLPSAEPEIIRCKDCRWHNGEINQCNAQICASMCGEDFCSRAERRTDE